MTVIWGKVWVFHKSNIQAVIQQNTTNEYIHRLNQWNVPYKLTFGNSSPKTNKHFSRLSKINKGYSVILYCAVHPKCTTRHLEFILWCHYRYLSDSIIFITSHKLFAFNGHGNIIQFSYLQMVILNWSIIYFELNYFRNVWCFNIFCSEMIHYYFWIQFAGDFFVYFSFKNYYSNASDYITNKTLFLREIVSFA